MFHAHKLPNYCGLHKHLVAQYNEHRTSYFGNDSFTKNIKQNKSHFKSVIASKKNPHSFVVIPLSQDFHFQFLRTRHKVRESKPKASFPIWKFDWCPKSIIPNRWFGNPISFLESQNFLDMVQKVNVSNKILFGPVQKVLAFPKWNWISRTLSGNSEV